MIKHIYNESAHLIESSDADFNTMTGNTKFKRGREVINLPVFLLLAG